MRGPGSSVEVLNNVNSPVSNSPKPLDEGGIFARYKLCKTVGVGFICLVAMLVFLLRLYGDSLKKNNSSTE